MNADAERRDPRRRAATLHRVISWMQNRRIPFTDLPADVVPPAAAARIVRRIALRGLVRWVGSGWVPSPLLGARVSLQTVDAAAPSPAGTDGGFVLRTPALS